MLGILLRQASVPAMQLDAAVYGKVVVGWSAKKLKADGTFPPPAYAVAYGTPGIDVDAAAFFIPFMAEKIVLVCHYGYDRQVMKALQHLGTQLRVTRQVGVHAVVGYRRPLYLAVRPPQCGIACRLVRLVKDALGKEIGCCSDIAPDAV